MVELISTVNTRSLPRIGYVTPILRCDCDTRTSPVVASPHRVHACVCRLTCAVPQPAHPVADKSPRVSHGDGKADDSDGQAALGLHVDDAEVTLNVCLGSDHFEGTAND